MDTAMDFARREVEIGGQEVKVRERHYEVRRVGRRVHRMQHGAFDSAGILAAANGKIGLGIEIYHQGAVVRELVGEILYQ